MAGSIGGEGGVQPSTVDIFTGQARLRVAFGCFLTAAAGFVDAIGYLHIGTINLSFMSGNTTGLATRLAALDAAAILAVGSIVATFVLGAFTGTFIAHAAGPRRRVPCVLSCEALLCGLALALTSRSGDVVSLLPICLAMGMQNVLHRDVAGIGVGQGFVTGILYQFGERLALLLKTGTGRTQLAILAAAWTSLLGGAVIGAVMMLRFGIETALWTIFIVLTVTSVSAAIMTAFVTPRPERV